MPELQSTTLLIENLALSIRVDVGDAERSAPQRLLVSLRVEVAAPAPQADEVAEVVDYGVIAEGIRALAAREVKLLETLAQEIAALALSDRRATSVAVELRKPDLFQDCEAVGIVARFAQSAPQNG